MKIKRQKIQTIIAIRFKPEIQERMSEDSIVPKFR